MSKICLFCEIRSKPYYEAINITESRYFFSIFDVHPVSPGHALVIPKRHVISLLDLNQREWANLKSMIQQTIKVIEETNFRVLYKKVNNEQPTDKTSWFTDKMLTHFAIREKPQGYNIGNNEGELAGRTVHHLHIQIIPRYKGDVENPVGGIRTIIPKLGDYRTKG